MQKLLVVFLFVLSLMTGWANNIKINSEAKVVGFTGSGRDTAIVEFGVSWDNSWRDDFNWDAAWIFLKYKKRGVNAEWQHAYLAREGHTAQPQSGNEGGDYMFMFGEIGSGNDAKVTGVYLIREGIAEGKVNTTVQVKWPIAANKRVPLTASDFGNNRDSVYVAAYAIEMVYVPYGDYTLGDGYSNKSFSVKVSSEDPLKLVNNNLTLSASYPKGYRGFYAMKYEVSQEQYVEFLNSLTLTQQKNRVMNNDFEHMSKGDYVFGDRKRPNCRNGIAFLMQKGAGAPALFGNNLNAGNKFYSADDGQTLACNYLSPADMLAYCDWSGLRPMSELEYEKSCRRPSPQTPDKGEYAWNSNSGVNRLRTLGDLTGSQTERETPFDYKVNVNAGKRVNGPVRSGAFATSRTGQQESGATYWGLMEMSGNLWELCYNANSSGSVFKGDNLSYSHGDGYLNANGTTDIGTSYWPSAVAAFGVRGGSFASEDNLLRTSDRTYAEGTYFSALTQRDSSVGFRGVRSMLNTTGFTAGRIYCANGLDQDTVCSGEEFTITGEPAEKTIGKTTYVWYISENNGTTWSMLEDQVGLSLNYEGIVNSTTAPKIYLFKRKVNCAVGELFTSLVKIVIPAVFAAPALEDAAAIAIIGKSLTLTMPTGPSGALYVWTHPDGARTHSATLTISSFSLDDAGVYYASYSGKCEGNRKAIEIFPYEEVGKQAFYYKGSEEMANVPVAATHVRAYLIGASGGGGAYSAGSYYSGAGGYTDVLFPVGGQVGVIVGQGGPSGYRSTRSKAAYPNGGIGQGGDVSSGGGGGRSQVRFVSGNSLIAIAGGGGGNTGFAGTSGAGGGLSGQSSTGGYSTGGTQTAGGGPRRGGYLQGAHANSSTADDCGGGGDGYYGGGTTTGDGRPAGGGSGYINRSICIMGKTYTGNYQNRPSQVGSTIVGYSTGKYGIGVISLASGRTSTPGNNGMVVLQYLKRLTK